LAQGVMNEIWIAGSLQTNERFLGELLNHPWVQEEIFHAGFVDEEFIPELRPPGELLPLFAKVCELSRKSESSKKGDVRWSVGEKWVKAEVLHATQLRWKRGPVFRSYGSYDGSHIISGEIELKNGVDVGICVVPVANRWQVRIGKWFQIVRCIHVSDPPLQKKDLKRKLSALVTGRVHAILYRTGSVVAPHEALVIIESLGHFVPHALPISARVVSWTVMAEDRVNAGQELAVIDVSNSG
jgi:hypothetical protein